MYVVANFYLAIRAGDVMRQSDVGCCCSTIISRTTYRRASIDVWKRWWEQTTARRPTFGAPHAWYVMPRNSFAIRTVPDEQKVALSEKNPPWVYSKNLACLKEFVHMMVKNVRSLEQTWWFSFRFLHNKSLMSCNIRFTGSENCASVLPVAPNSICPTVSGQKPIGQKPIGQKPIEHKMPWCRRENRAMPL